MSTRPTLRSAPCLRAESLEAPGFGPVDLELAAGECMAIRGASGSGKTRLLRALADLDPHAGTVWLDGADRSTIAPTEWRRRVGLVPAHPEWWADTPRRHFRVAPEAERLDALGLACALLDAPVEQLSTGERQRLALLRTLENHPTVLLLDEPTGSLDGDSTARIEALVTELRSARGTAVVWVTHDAAQAGRIAALESRMTAGRLGALG